MEICDPLNSSPNDSKGSDTSFPAMNEATDITVEHEDDKTDKFCHQLSSSCNDSEGSDTLPTMKASDTEEHADDKDDFDLGFIFDSDLPSHQENLAFETPEGETIDVVLSVADGDAGSVQSGHYLWPAASLLARYLVEDCSSLRPRVVVELGAGCGLCSLISWRLWAENSLQCLVVSDRDPSVLERARDNHETALEELLSKDSLTEDEFNCTINNVGSIPVCFETIEWGQESDISTVRERISDHAVPPQNHANLILGSDVIYDSSVVRPLLKTAHDLMMKKDENMGGGTTRFLLSQSFAYDEQTENELSRCCQELGLAPTVLLSNGEERIQEFQLVAYPDGPAA